MKELKDKVTCEICNREFKQITTRHLKTHNTSVPEYIINFPNIDIMSEKRRAFCNSKEFKSSQSKGMTAYNKTISDEERQAKIDRLFVGLENMSHEAKEKMSADRSELLRNRVHTKEMRERYRVTHNAWLNSLTPEQKKEIANKRKETMKNWSDEKKADVFKNQSEARKKVNENMSDETRQQMSKRQSIFMRQHRKSLTIKQELSRVRKFKETLKNRTKEQKELTSLRRSKAITEHIRKYGLKSVSFSPMIGRNETAALDMIEYKLDINITRQYQVLRYFVDGYDEVNNVVYEVNECYHRSSEKQMKKDEIRMNNIIKELNCGFVIINDDQKVIY